MSMKRRAFITLLGGAAAALPLTGTSGSIGEEMPGSDSVIRRCLLNFRFGSLFGLKSDISRGPSCAKSGCEQSQQSALHILLT
jgi:hypothetical protein